MQLGIIGLNFPEKRYSLAKCGCPLRTAPHAFPKHLPFAAGKAVVNDETMNTEQICVEICCHQPFPAMTGPTMEIHVDDSVQPVVTRRPLNVPAHWQRGSANQLEQDIAFDVFERVPTSTPFTRLYSMTLTAEWGGTTQRTVDLQSL